MGLSSIVYLLFCTYKSEMIGSLTLLSLKLPCLDSFINWVFATLLRKPNVARRRLSQLYMCACARAGAYAMVGYHVMADVTTIRVCACARAGDHA